MLAQPSNQTSRVNGPATLVLNVTNLHGTPLTFTAGGLPPGLAINGSTGVITGVPNTTGIYRVSVSVSNGSTTLTGNFTWSIVGTLPPGAGAPNYPPAMDQVLDQKSPIDHPVTFTLLARDPEGQPLHFSATGLPPGLSLDSSSGVISGTATELGSYQVTVTVSDGEQITVRSFRWAVVRINEMETSSATADPSETSGTTSVQDLVDVSGDFDGDGRNDLGTYRLSSGEWKIWTSGFNFAKSMSFVWGAPGDLPVPADYNGDRVTDFAVYRPSTGTWHLSLSNSQTPLAIQWGGADDRPVALDHDGDGKADLALIRDGGYDILLSSANYLKSIQVR
jgi:hypothetical protein